ncbi:transcriptional repressor TCF25-domain-containing protein [Ephemerocybe angulata]|uniref:Transcriptional repressor TCF25-domain-containing protein n=1 Tax=Ephemerocybe angulata TaxID=980116 RepID=A0A8H6M5T5_9AGAR|nr:transcriptional repressor TCF25-domain-containing protein [Tulosesus angulatus]
MPPRLNKRQQRELEELEALGKPEQAASDSEVEPEPIPAPKAPGGFAALMAGNDEESEEEDIDQTKPSKSRKSKKKKKVTTTESPKPVVVETPPPSHTPKATPTPAASKKALKKAKAKEKKAANDELDQALAELSLKYGKSQSMAQVTVTGQTFADLLSVSVQHLDSEAEMRKFFGSKVVTANKDSGSQGGPSRRKAPAVRSQLTRPQPTWWSAKGREGLSIRALSDEEVDAKLKSHGWEPMPQERWWTVEYSKRYKSLTKVFMGTVLSGDPQGFWDLLGKSPWHGDTLLQVSEVYRHREEYAQAFDFVDRALFTYERAFVGSFNFTGGSNRLDFDYVENRPFYLAVHRQVADLLRRGCVRTSFEFAKLLYSLDPWSDPHGSLLHLDFLAIKSGMHQWLIDVFDLFNGEKGDPGRINPSLLPGWTYTRALALRVAELSDKSDHSKSTAALREALNDFPYVVPLLADKLDVSIPASIRSHPDFKIETGAIGLKPAHSTAHLLSHLYAQKSHVLWKEHSDWFLETVTSTFSALPSRLPITPRRKEFLALYDRLEPRYSVYRHLVVLETTHKNLFPFIDINLERVRGLTCDPLPPPTAVNLYGDEYFKGVDDLLSFTTRARTRREREVDERRLAQMIPDANFRQQLQGFFNDNPNFVERFPGGILQFAQAIAQLPPDVLDDMMMAQAMGGPAAGGMDAGAFAGGMGMPGGLDIEDLNPAGPVPVGVGGPWGAGGNDGPGAEEGGGDWSDGEDHGGEEEMIDEDEEDEENISPMPRVIRNILGRFWGRAPAEEESSEEEEGELLDDTGVD